MACSKLFKKPFDPNFDISQLTISVENLRTMRAHDTTQMAQVLNEFGFAIVSCSDMSNPDEDLLSLQNYFGSIYKHPRSNESGISPIAVAKGHPDYLGASNVAHPPHTDGAFLDVPPRVTTLQCIVPATKGGDSVLVSGQRLFEFLSANFRDTLPYLFDNDALIVERIDQASRGPVFTSVSELVQMRFRSDQVATLKVKAQAEQAFEAARNWVLDEKNQLIFSLKAGQVLIADNTAVLHGRTAFAAGEKRKLNRLNFFGDAKLCNLIEFGFATPKEVNRCIRAHSMHTSAPIV